MQAFLKAVKDVGLLVLRLVMGATMIIDGWHRWQAMTPDTGLSVWLVIAFEVLGGVLLLFGLGTPLIGLGIVIQKVGIVLFLQNEAGVGLLQQEIGYVAVMAAVGFLLLTHGSGRLGIDALFLRPTEEKHTRLIGDAPEQTG